MQLQLTCPNCQTPFLAEVRQVIDVGQEPELKQLFLSGQLSMAQCPNCRAVTRVTSPVLYHDPEHELFMVHVPMELSLPYAEQEKVIGQLVKQAMDSLPAEKRRGYMFQPQTVLSLQTFMEKILETEGVTPEMMARQRSQSELLQSLSLADKSTVDELLESREDEIDEVFFSMLRAAMESAEQSGQEDQLLKLINLQARLYRQTSFGRELEQRQKALHAFSREAKKEGLTHDLLLKHVLANRKDLRTVDALVMTGQQAFDYEFFVQLSSKIEKRQKAGIAADDYLALREHLLERQKTMQEQSREIIEGARDTLEAILNARDPAQAVKANLGRMDDAFMYVLSSNIAQAEERGLTDQLAALRQIHNLILNEAQQQMPPEIALVNQLLELESDDERRQLLVDNQEMVNGDLLQFVKALKDEVQASGEEVLKSRLASLEAMIALQV